jgi:hypothetical protein
MLPMNIGQKTGSRPAQSSAKNMPGSGKHQRQAAFWSGQGYVLAALNTQQDSCQGYVC